MFNLLELVCVSLGGGAKKPSLPPEPPPAPTPVAASDLQEGETAAGKERSIAQRRKGRRSTILNEPTLGGVQAERQSLLGNTGI